MNFKRLEAVDWLRGLAMIFMIQAHIVFYISPWYPALKSGELSSSSWLYKWVDLDTFAAPAFVFLVGFSLYLWREKNKSLGLSQQQKQVFKRGLIIFLLGFFMSWVMRGHWMLNDILNVIGFSLMLFALIWRLPIGVIFCLATLLLVIAPYGQAWSGYLLLDFYTLVWPGHDDGGWTASEVLVNYLLRGNQALIPWVSFVLFGWCTAWVWFKNKAFWGLGVLTIVLYLLYWIITHFELGSPYVFHFAYYPASTAFMVQSLSIIIGLLLILHFIALKALPFGGIVSRFLTLYSRFSLTVYVVHLILCLGSLRWAGIIFHGDDAFFTERLLSWFQALLLSWVFMIGLAFALHYWEKANGGKYSLKWWLKKNLYLAC